LEFDFLYSDGADVLFGTNVFDESKKEEIKYQNKYNLLGSVEVSLAPLRIID
jgi:hypothetical protein